MRPYLPTETRPVLRPRGLAGRRRTWPRQPGFAIAILSFWLGLLWVAAVRPLAAPDEPAYLQTVMQVRNEHRLPEIHFDFSQVPAGQVVGTPGDPAVREYTRQIGVGDPPVRLLAYQTVQPPLYFLLTGLLAQAVPPDPVPVLYLSRLVSALCGAAMVYFCWAATRELAPRAPMWAVAVAGVIALLPEFCFNNARAANDSLVNCCAAAAFYVWFRGLRQPEYDPWLVRGGALVGLAVLAKLTALVLIPALGLVVLCRAYQVAPARGRWAARARRGAQMAGGAGASALFICGWWFVRNLIAYGEPSGTRDANIFWHATLPLLDWNNADARNGFILASWQSFWGYFGWQNIIMPPEFYDQARLFSSGLVGLTLLAVLGLAAGGLWRRWPVPRHLWQSLLILAVVAVLLLISFVQFSLTVAMQAQGRYLFLLLLPGALIFTFGLYTLAPGRLLKVLALSLPLLWLGVMNAVGLSLVR
ncbi:MAG TPA: glycosyltransferase family 39 protein [Chloroflexia bacterium]|nr:glycosyltransferase family 39 protein [Chloroflexia bacterium]